MGNIFEVGRVSPWAAKTIILLASIVMVAIRAPHGRRRSRIPAVRSRRGTLEILLLTLAWLSFFLPLIWIATPLLASADYPLRPIPLLAGTVCLALGLWLFHLSHADLGDNWSIRLEVLDNHSLVTQGVYRRVRHPMYTALLLYSVGQALVLPNYVAGPSSAVAMALLVALRIGPEERMMVEQFGANYRQYAAVTKRLLPGVW
jgi:protein-S-isoprenylcysteine O-methyltransferase Ste14